MTVGLGRLASSVPTGTKLEDADSRCRKESMTPWISLSWADMIWEKTTAEGTCEFFPNSMSRPKFYQRNFHGEV